MSQNQQALENLFSDCEKLHDEFSSFKASFDQELNKLLDECQVFLKQVNCTDDGENAAGTGSADPETRVRLLQLQQQLKKRLSEASKRHRELHAPLSKMGKLIDRSFMTELPPTLSPAQLESDAEKLQILNTAICEHLIREGSMEVAQELIREAGLDYEASHLSAYAALNRVVESLAKRQLEPALQWLESNRDHLSSPETHRYLEFLVRRLELVQLMTREEPAPADAILRQARRLAAFSPDCDADIRRLMGSLAFLRRNLLASPYKDLFEARLYHELSQLLVSEANKMLGFAKDLPLSVAISAGCIAMPPLLNIQAVMSQRNLGSGIAGELPIDIDLGERHRFHSVFACPILRTQTSETNPPVRLVCGHAISRDAVAKLANNSSKFKCPYCPMEMETSQVQDIYF